MTDGSDTSTLHDDVGSGTDVDMKFDSITFENLDGVGLLTLNRPAVLNSLTPDMHVEIRTVLTHIDKTPEIRALVITGAGRGFSAGADLSEIDMTPDDELLDRIDPGKLLANAYNPTVAMFKSLRVPTIAAVNGVAAGAGASMAMLCDLIVCHPKSYFVQSFSKIGMIPDAGATWSLVNRIGYGRAMGLCMTGERLDAERARDWGLVWSVHEECVTEALSIAARFAVMPTRALVALRNVLDAATCSDIERQVELETRVQSELGRNPDFIEGVTAFMEKRPPVFRGV